MEKTDLSIRKSGKRYGFLLVILLLGLTGCFKDFEEDFYLKGYVVEFDASSRLSVSPGKNYPVLGPLEKGSGLHTYQVNLVGGQKPVPQTLTYRVVEDETTAIQGRHYRLPGNGTFEIPANSSFGDVAVEVLDFPSETGNAVLVLELVGNDETKANENYKRLGISISLTGPPSEEYPLHEQLGPENLFNTIEIDPLHPKLPKDFKDRWAQATANLAAYATGGRHLHSMYLRFGENQTLDVVALYFGGGGTSLTSYANAIWTYNLNINDQGVANLEFVSANGNGNAQYSNFAPLLSDYLEKYEFKVDWVESSVATPTRPGTQLGGFFRIDDPTSFVFGSLANITGTNWSMPSSPVIYDLFNNNNGGLYSTVLIDPDHPAQSQEFRNRWNAAKTAIEAASGRKLHKMMLAFDDKFNDVRLVTYYYTSSGGKVIGQNRYELKIDHDGVMKLTWFYRDANGGATSTPQIIDDFFNIREFKISRTASPPAGGEYLTFTRKDDPSSYFIGSLGNHPIGVSQFFPE